MKTKISYYLSHPIQYFSPLFRLMAEEFDLHVYYFSDASIKGNMDVGFGQKIKWDIPLLEGYSYSFLKNISKRKTVSNRMWDVINPSVIKLLYRNKSPIIIVNGWSYFSDLLTIFIAKLLGRKVWLRAENPLNQELRKSKLTLFVKKIVLSYLLFPFINKFLYIGSESKRFFEFYNIKPSRLVYTPYAVDNQFLISKHGQYNNKESLKKELGLPVDKTVILFSGKYIEKKRPIDLIKAFKLLNVNGAILVMVGDGELRIDMEAYIMENNIENIFLTGFVNQSQIVKYYVIADIFVMCSGMGETWGLSVNEAMNFSLPIVISDTCGCAGDLVQNNVNGFRYEEGNIEALANSICILLRDKNFRMECGEASLKIVRNFSNDRIVKNIMEAIG